MPSTKNPWVKRRNDADDWAELFGSRYVGNEGSVVPTALGAMAREQRIKRVEFLPLLVEGGLTIESDGFVMMVRCERDESDAFARSFASDETGALLPPRKRFTIAHEIAHTFFFDTSCTPPRSTVNFENKRTLHSLEKACNRAASQLLLPESLLSKFYSTSGLLNPGILREIATKAAISSPALVVRLEWLRRYPKPNGIVCSVEEARDEFIFSAVARHLGFRGLFTEVAPGESIRKLIKDQDFILNGGGRHEVRVKRAIIPGGRCRDYIIVAERTERTSRRKAYFVTIREEL